MRDSSCGLRIILRPPPLLGSISVLYSLKTRTVTLARALPPLLEFDPFIVRLASENGDVDGRRGEVR